MRAALSSTAISVRAIAAAVLCAGGVGCAAAPPRHDAAPLGPPAPDTSPIVAALPDASGRPLLLPDAAADVAISMRALDDLVRAVPDVWVLAATPAGLLSIGADPREGLATLLAERYGVDVRRPILASVGVTSPERIQRAIDAMVGAAGTLAPDDPAPLQTVLAPFAADASLSLRHRVVVPLAPGTEPSKPIGFISAFAEALEDWRDCKSVPACRAAADPSLVAVSQSEGLTAIALVRGSHLVLDVYMSIVPGVGDLSLSDAIQTSSSPSDASGIDPRCVTPLDHEAATACVDAERAASASAAWSWSQVVEVLPSVDPSAYSAILVTARAEVGVLEPLARPEPRFLERGRFAAGVRGAPAAPELMWTASWTTTEHGQRAFERALAEPVVLRGTGQLVERALTPMKAALGDPGEGFRDEGTVVRTLMEGGWGTWPILLTRTWPNILAALAQSRIPSDVVSAGEELAVRLAVSGESVELEVAYAVPKGRAP